MAILTLKHNEDVTLLTLYDSEAHDGDVYPKCVQREFHNIKPDIFSSICESYFKPPLYRRLFHTGSSVRKSKRKSGQFVVVQFLIGLWALFFFATMTSFVVICFLPPSKPVEHSAPIDHPAPIDEPNSLGPIAPADPAPDPGLDPAPSSPSVLSILLEIPSIFSILLGSGGIIAVVQTFLNTRRGEISVKRNDEGKITEIILKGVAHEEVPILLKEISKSLEKSDKRLINFNNHS